jgi:hypothetical protein
MVTVAVPAEKAHMTAADAGVAPSGAAPTTKHIRNETASPFRRRDL